MAKSKLKSLTTGELAPPVLLEEEKTFDILEASIKDDFCKYKYEIIKGVGEGDQHDVKGTGRVKDSLLEAFAKFAVHLAFIDGAFKGQEIKDIDKLHTDEITLDYRITGFKMKGGSSNESISLFGNKYAPNVQGRMNIDTPPAAIDNLSSYKWWNELKAAADDVRREVSLYKLGNYIAMNTDDEEEKDNAAQMSIMDGIEDKDFEKHKI